MNQFPRTSRRVGQDDMPMDTSTEYRTWGEIAAYFDGDGALKVHTGMYVLTLEGSFSDQDLEQVRAVDLFLKKRGILGCLSKYVNKKSGPYYELGIPEGQNLVLMLKRMLPHSIKKRSQIRAAIDYLENRTTGNEFVEAMNEAVRYRKRSSEIKFPNLPLKKREGVLAARRSARSGKRALNHDELLMLKRDRESGMTWVALGKKYHVDSSTANLSY